MRACVAAIRAEVVRVGQTVLFCFGLFLFVAPGRSEAVESPALCQELEILRGIPVELLAAWTDPATDGLRSDATPERSVDDARCSAVLDCMIRAGTIGIPESSVNAPDDVRQEQPSRDEVCSRLIRLIDLSPSAASAWVVEVDERRKSRDVGSLPTNTDERLERCTTFLRCSDSARSDPVPVDESWKSAFERICGATAEADTLATEELRRLVIECDALLQRIRELEIPRGKVYTFRLEKCKQFFEYLLTLREEANDTD